MIATSTVYDIIHKALRVCGVVGLGDTVDPLVSQEALLLLNGLRAEWSLNVKSYRRYEQTCQALANKQFITLGQGGDIAERPNSITHVIVINGVPGGAVNNWEIPIFPHDAYRALAIQHIYAAPAAAYIDNEFPLTSIYFSPGLAIGWGVRVLGTAYLGDYENIGDTFADPPEYFDALYLNLAVRLADLWGAQLPEGIVQRANGALKHIKHHMLVTRMGIMPDGLGVNSAGGVNFMSGMP